MVLINVFIRQDISLKALLGAKGPAQLSLKPNQPEGEAILPAFAFILLHSTS